MRRLRVANVITRMSGGAGGVALRGALALDPARYETTIITGGAGLDGLSVPAEWPAPDRPPSDAMPHPDGWPAPGQPSPTPVVGYPLVLTGEAALIGAPAGDLLAEAYAAGLTVVRLPDLVPQIDPRRDLRALQVLTRIFAEGGYDVVHTHTAKAGALGRIAARRVGHLRRTGHDQRGYQLRQTGHGQLSGTGPVRVVHTFHGFPFHGFQPLWRRSLYVRAERWLGRRTDAFLAVGSAVAAEAVRRRLAPPDRIRVIPPAIAPGDGPGRHPRGCSGRHPGGCPGDELARARGRRRMGVPSNVPLVGVVGRVDYQKAPEQWVDALAAAGDDVWGVWIGDGPLWDRLAARVRRRGLGERFRWLGYRTDVPDLLPGLDVFALASRYEGLPCALVEAMRAGVPVAATSVNAVPELVVPGETGMLAPPAQPRLLGHAIRYLLDHPEDARRMAATAAARLGDRFTPDVLGTVLDQTYRTPAPHATSPSPRPSLPGSRPLSINGRYSATGSDPLSINGDRKQARSGY
jgi:glycosyltransferase involved in cell wall biosynthesis